MSYAALATRSGVSMATVVRILSGPSPEAAYSNVEAIARALEMAIEVKPRMSTDAVLRRRAGRKAETIVALVQGSSGLDGRAVPDCVLKRMKRRTAQELLAGPRRRLW